MFSRRAASVSSPSEVQVSRRLVPATSLPHDCSPGQKPCLSLQATGLCLPLQSELTGTRSLRASPGPLLITSRGTPHLKDDLPANLRPRASSEDKEGLLMECPHPYRKVSLRSSLSPLLTLLYLRTSFSLWSSPQKTPISETPGPSPPRLLCPSSRQ